MKEKHVSRRGFLKRAAAAAGAGLAMPLATGASPLNHAGSLGKAAEPIFRISLAEWSLNRALFAGRMDHLDFPAFARSLGIEAVEYVNQFFMDKAKDQSYLQEMKSRCDSEGVRSLLIMCDSEGAIGHPEESERSRAVENHKKWVEAAAFLGCHSIRVNGYHPGVENYEEAQRLVSDGLRRICEFADGHGLNVLIENHGGLSSNGKWLAGVMEMADHPRAGTMPDFGNFRIDRNTSYDSYLGVAELMPYAKAVSVKPIVWDDQEHQQPLDYKRMMDIVLQAGYRGHAGIEHGEEGEEARSILVVKNRLERARRELEDDYA